MRYRNFDERFGVDVEFTIEEMIKQYQLCGWDQYCDENGVYCIMTEDEIVADIMKHDIEPVN